MVNQNDRAFDDLRNTVHEYAQILRRRWRTGLLAACIVSSVAFWTSQYLPRQYDATTIFERRDDVVLRNLIHQNSPYSFDQLKSSIVLDMTGSRALAAAAVDTGLLPEDAITSENALTNDELRSLDQTLHAYDLNAAVRMVHSSASLDTIELRCAANDAEIATHFVVALRDGYIRRTRGRIAEILGGTRDFFATEFTRFQQAASETNRKLKEQFVEFPGIDPSDPASAGTRLETLQSERLRLAQRRAEIEAQIAARERFLTSALLTEPTKTMRASAATAPPNVTPPPVLPNTNSAIDQAIRQVEQELADAIVLNRMTNEHPTVRALQRKLDNLYAARGAIQLPPPGANAPPARINAPQQIQTLDPVLAGQRLRVELELDALRSQFRIADEHLRQADERVTAFAALYDRLLENSDSVQQLQNQLDQDVTTAAIWQQHLSQLERILAAESEERGTQFSLVEEPKKNGRPIRPQAAAIFIVCLGCGLAAAALLLALAELMDRSFRSASQVTRTLGLPILECIGVINTPQVKRRRLVARLAWTPALCLLVSSVVLTASLAYTSLEYPRLHRRAISTLNDVLDTVGVPPTNLNGQRDE